MVSNFLLLPCRKKATSMCSTGIVSAWPINRELGILCHRTLVLFHVSIGASKICGVCPKCKQESNNLHLKGPEYASDCCSMLVFFFFGSCGGACQFKAVSVAGPLRLCVPQWFGAGELEQDGQRAVARGPQHGCSLSFMLGFPKYPEVHSGSFALPAAVAVEICFNDPWAGAALGFQALERELREIPLLGSVGLWFRV